MSELYVYNTLSRQKEKFEPISYPHVGIYVCGPTVYNEAHIGNGRPPVVFDVLGRYLSYLGYKVRLVRNITDVGHLLGDTNEGEDRISKQARQERIEPMEIVYNYTQKYHHVIDSLNVKRPNIEPTATGHILEQIEITQKIIETGFAYVSNGSVYFDVAKYNEKYNYGELSGRVVDELLNNTRELDGQAEKHHPADFALWKKAAPEHLMHWNSPWSVGFPGWHIECTVMSRKYLGDTFDIHGGGMDLAFPHHECEIAQAKAANNGIAPVKYWMHNNMITVDGKKMSKADGNFITLNELFEGNHPLLSKAYSPMVVRLFILQAQYRSTIDFSDKALSDAQKNYKSFINGLRAIKNMVYPIATTPNPSLQGGEFETPLLPKEGLGVVIDTKVEEEVKQTIKDIFVALNDDLNTALALAHLLNLLKKINIFMSNPAKITTISEEIFVELKEKFVLVFEEILGLKEETPKGAFYVLLDSLMAQYRLAKEEKAYNKVDAIRANLKSIGVVVKDMKHAIDWAYDE